MTNILPTTVIFLATIGSFAAKTLQSASGFVIRGLTSRGIFTLVDDQTIIFLSRESYKGPLIANLPWDEPILDRINLKSRGTIADRCYHFEDLDLIIDCAVAETWSALSTWNPTSLPHENPTTERIVDFLDRVRRISENELVAAVIGEISGRDATHPGVENELEAEIKKFGAALRDANAVDVDQEARYFAGRGRGLTPSGDDFLLGIVYALSSLQNRLNSDQTALIESIASTVRRRSTLISANLVDCAAAGEVDERIGKAFHALFDPARSMDQAATELGTWGSSSGLDTAAGFCLLLNHINK